MSAGRPSQPKTWTRSGRRTCTSRTCCAERRRSRGACFTSRQRAASGTGARPRGPSRARCRSRTCPA
eukprot:7345913-Prymnesium_polylepis.1